jgi:ceramide glucosyltransferase
MMTAWQFAVALLLSFSALGLAVNLVSHVLVWAVVRHRTRAPASVDKVTVLKPLCGADPNLGENLEAFARQSHEDLELVFGVAALDDPALPVALRFCRDHRSVPTRIIVGESAHIDNPKVALLERMSWQSQADWIVVSDSNVRVGSGYVRDALGLAAADVGLVTHLVAGDAGRSFAAHAENLMLNCFVAPAVCGARFVAGQTCVIGKSMFLRRDALEAIGGFQAAGGFLAEDYVIGQAVQRAGFRVVLAPTPVAAWHEGWTLSRFFNRHSRWAVMRRRVSKSAYLTEILFTPGPALGVLLVLGLFAPGSGVDSLWAGVGLAMGQVLSAITYTRMTGRCIPLAAFAINPLREWLTLGIWVCGWFLQSVEWRGKGYRVGAGSALQPLGTRLNEEVVR